MLSEENLKLSTKPEDNDIHLPQQANAKCTFPPLNGLGCRTFSCPLYALGGCCEGSCTFLADAVSIQKECCL